MKETKAFYKTSEFWLMVLAQFVLVLQESGIIDLVATKYNWLAPILQTLLASSYITSRGKAKAGVPHADDSSINEFTTPDAVTVEPGTNVSTP
jgi:hypothetical protein